MHGFSSFRVQRPYSIFAGRRAPRRRTASSATRTSRRRTSGRPDIMTQDQRRPDPRGTGFYGVCSSTVANLSSQPCRCDFGGCLPTVATTRRDGRQLGRARRSFFEAHTTVSSPYTNGILTFPCQGTPTREPRPHRSLDGTTVQYQDRSCLRPRDGERKTIGSRTLSSLPCPPPSTVCPTNPPGSGRAGAGAEAGPARGVVSSQMATTGVRRSGPTLQAPMPNRGFARTRRGWAANYQKDYDTGVTSSPTPRGVLTDLVRLALWLLFSLSAGADWAWRFFLPLYRFLLSPFRGRPGEAEDGRVTGW